MERATVMHGGAHSGRQRVWVWERRTHDECRQGFYFGVLFFRRHAHTNQMKVVGASFFCIAGWHARFELFFRNVCARLRNQKLCVTVIMGKQDNVLACYIYGLCKA